MAANRHDQNSEQEVHVPDISRPEGRHEVTDVNAWAVGKFGIALVLLCIVALGILVGVFRYFMSENGGKLPRTELDVDARQLPVEPRLQRAPILDLQRFRAAEDQILNSYGWVDQKQGIVRIPIGRAIDLLAQRGLPARAPNAAPPPSGVSVPTEAGLGPKLQQPGGPLAYELKRAAAGQPAAAGSGAQSANGSGTPAQPAPAAPPPGQANH